MITRVAVIERDNQIIKRAFTDEDEETAQLAAVFWLEEIWRPVKPTVLSRLLFQKLISGRDGL